MEQKQLLTEEIEKVSVLIFNKYMSLAELEFRGKIHSKEYTEIKEHLLFLKQYEGKIYGQLLKDEEMFKRMYSNYFMAEEEVNDVLQLSSTHLDSTVCPYYRIIVKLCNEVLFHELQLDLPTGMKAVGEREASLNFLYTYSAIRNSVKHDLTYLSLLGIQDALQQEVEDSSQEKLSLLKVKYYYIFLSPKAETLFFEPRETKEELVFPPCPCLSKNLLERNRASVFYPIFFSEYDLQLCCYIDNVMNAWLSYSSIKKEDVFVSDILLRTRLNASLCLAQENQYPKFNNLLNKNNEQAKLNRNQDAKNYGYIKICECFYDKEKVKQKLMHPLSN